MYNEAMSAADMITRVFENIDKATIEKTNRFLVAWRETVAKINGYGEKLVAHTKIVDLKNGVLLVETDHPGWSQILQMNENFIVRGLNMKVPDSKIKNLMIRLEGSDAKLHSVSYEESLQIGMEKRLAKNEAASNKFHKYTQTQDSENLPPELLKQFEILKKNAK